MTVRVQAESRRSGLTSWDAWRRVLSLWQWTRRSRESERDADPTPGRDATGHHDLVTRIKEEMRRQFDGGARPTAAHYLALHPELRSDHERVLSLIYEEFCLLEECSGAPDPIQFCDRYEPWRDSVLSQLRYHRELSRMVSQPRRTWTFPKPGERFLRYRLESELGRGGAARVFLAHDETLGDRLVALKVSPNQGEEPSIQGRLDHPHIVAVTQVEHEPRTGLRALCMPYSPGLPLDVLIRKIDPQANRRRSARDLLDAFRSLEPGAEGDATHAEPVGIDWPGFPADGTYFEAAAWLILKLAEALAHAHRRGVFHRDIKPANILVTVRSGSMLLDFNLAHSTSLAAATLTASAGGTLPYMAPEHLAAFLDPNRWPEVGSAADLYSLGLVFRELLTGQRPELPDHASATIRTISDLLDQRRAGAPPSVRTVNPQIPHGLDAILTRCLAPDQNQRYQDAATLAEDLRRFLDHRPLVTATNPSRRERTLNWVQRNRRTLGRLTIAVLVLAPLMLVIREWRDSESNAAMRAESQIDSASQYVRQKRLDQAFECYRKALKFRPNWYKAFQGFAVIASQKGRYEESLKYFDEAIRLADSDTTAAPARIAAIRLDRASVLIKLSEQVLAATVKPSEKSGTGSSDATPAQYDLAGRYYQRVLEDQAWAKTHRSEPFSHTDEYYAAVAIAGKGRIASVHGDHTSALYLYRLALDRTHLAETLAPSSEWKAQFTSPAIEQINDQIQYEAKLAGIAVSAER